MEPLVSYNFESRWFLQCAPAITYDWTSESANASTIPMGADAGKKFETSSQPMSIKLAHPTS
jgi:hypothetical protein